MNLAFLLMPDHLVPSLAMLLIALAGICFVLQLVRPGRMFLLYAFVLLLLVPILSPLIEPLVDAVFDYAGTLYNATPWWVIPLLIVIAGLKLLQMLLGFVFGARVADHTVGTLAADVIRALLRICILWPVRLVSVLFRLRNR